MPDPIPGGSFAWRIPDEDVRRVCSYISDDRKAAQMLGIEEIRVREVRKRMPKRVLRQQSRSKWVNKLTGASTETEDRRKAIEGSDKLREAVFAYFRKHGHV